MSVLLNKYKNGLLFFVFFLLSLPVHSAGKCENSGLLSGRIMTEMCWSCYEHIYLMGQKIDFGMSSTYAMDAPDGRYKNWFCSCDRTLIGGPLGAWKTAYAVETVRSDWCSTMFGNVINADASGFAKHTVLPKKEHETVFRQTHTIAIPLEYILGFFSNASCSATGQTEIDFVSVSEVVAPYHDETLNIFTSGFAGLFANMAAMATSVAECAYVTVSNKTFSSIPFTAGCWGAIYPATGYASPSGSPVQVSKELTVANLAWMHNVGMMKKTYGSSGICGKGREYTLDKAGTMLNQFYPIAETKRKFAIGTPTLKEGEWKLKSSGADDFVQFSWKYKDCCIKYK